MLYLYNTVPSAPLTSISPSPKPVQRPSPRNSRKIDPKPKPNLQIAALGELDSAKRPAHTDGFSTFPASIWTGTNARRLLLKLVGYCCLLQVPKDAF